MDHIELSRLVKKAEWELTNRNWTQEFPSSKALNHESIVSSSYYLSGRRKESSDKNGLTALHLLMGIHTPLGAVESFFALRKRHQRFALYENSEPSPIVSDLFRSLPAPNPLHHQTNGGATVLHAAVYRNSWHLQDITEMLLKEAEDECGHVGRRQLVSTPMKYGSCALHIMCGHNTTIQGEVLKCLIEADPTVATREDSFEDNPFSLLWKNVLRFRWAISLENEQGDSEYIDGGLSWMTIITPDQYLSYSLCLLKNMKRVLKMEENMYESSFTLHEICSIPRCPPLLLRLSMSATYQKKFGITGDAFSLDNEGKLPIHYAVQMPVVTTNYVPMSCQDNYKSIVELLLEAYPKSVMAIDDSGRIPLHYALESGHVSEKILLQMIKLYPDSLRIPDPVSGLYPFMLVSSKRGMSTSIIKSSNWKEEMVHMTFFLLQICPDVLQYQLSDDHYSEILSEIL